MGRPSGSTDKTPRKKRSEWTQKEYTILRQHWNKLSIKEISKILNKTKGTVISKAKELKLINGERSFCQDIQKLINIDSKEKICGVYMIFNLEKHMIYIGSSLDCIKRYKNHLYRLQNKIHYNQRLQEDIKPFLDICVQRPIFQNFSILENGCWEFTGRIKKSGYGATICKIAGQTKHMTAHRVMYYKQYGTYPDLIRHTCNNKKCVNPDHLEEGSYGDNARDVIEPFRKEFEEIWIKYRGDRVKITEHFNWKINQERNNGDKYSNQVAIYENKLGLIKKYIDLLREPKSVGSRGPIKQTMEGRTQGRWKCIEGHVQLDKHLWECEKCQAWRLARTNNIARSNTSCDC